MSGEPLLPGWDRQVLSAVATLQRGMDLPVQARRAGTVPVYGSNGVDGWHDVTPVRGPGVITGRSGSIGNVYFEPSPFWPLNTTLYVRDFHGNEPKFVWRLLQWLRLERFAASTGVPSLNRNFVHPQPVKFPSLPEQRRIAECLDALDEAIRKTEQVIAKLQEMTQGLLHDLLTRGIDENGELGDPERHPEQFTDSPLGRIPREWEVSSVGEEFDITSGITLGTHRRPRNHPHPYLRVANVYRDRLALEDIATLEARPFELVGRTLEEGDLLVVEGHANPSEIGRCAMATQSVIGFAFQNHLFRLRPRRIRADFGLRWMNGQSTRNYWRRMCSTSSGLNTINRTMLSRISTVVPPADEQQRISGAMQVLGQRIEKESVQASKLRILKNGLMEDLLTGRVQVPVPEEAA